MAVLKLPLIKFLCTFVNLFLNHHKSFLISLYKPNLKTFQPYHSMATLGITIFQFHPTKEWALMMLTFLIKLKNSLKCYGLKEILLSELSQIVRRMILENLGVEKHMDEHMNSTKYHLRLMKYNTLQSNETEIGLRAHTDKSYITIVYQNQVNGLQVLTKGGQWINVDLTQDTFIVIIGDSLHAWTNGRMHVPFHRVMMRENKSRYSVSLFTVPKAEYTIKTPEELVDEEHPLLYKPFNHFEFITFCNTEEGMRCESALKTYCGV